LIWRKNNLKIFLKKKSVLCLSVTVITLLVISLIPDNLGAMDWPVKDAALARNFGWNDSGKPVMGMVFTGGTDIVAAESGEVIFSRQRG
jgi:hypothetical protein